MKLLPILLLCFQCLSFAVTVKDIDVDCDDPHIFKAVDEALKSYNNAKEDGNQFVLFRVTDAKKRNEANDQIHYFIGYEIHEGSCTVKSKLSWKDCQFQTDKPERGKCSAHLLQNTETKIQTVVSQNCSISKVQLEPIVTAVHHQCLGCPHPVGTNNEEILRFVRLATENMNRQGSHLYYFDLDRILNATRQVVSGWDYEIHYVVRKTNCSKIDFKTKDSNECKVDKEGETGECELNVSETPDGQVNDILVTCTSQAGLCLNCPLQVNPDDPELLTLLSQVIDDYNSNINVTKLHKLSKVVKATKYGFHENIYEVLFTMKSTNCSKPDYTILGDECDSGENAAFVRCLTAIVLERTRETIFFLGNLPEEEILKRVGENKVSLSCDTTINVTDKRINVHSAPECVKLGVKAYRMSGFSPLRMSHRTPNQRGENLQLFNPKVKQHQSRGNKKGHHKRPKQEHKGISDNKLHREHKDDHEDESSEEVVESESKANVQEELLALPNCPGKQWQPISVTTTLKPLTDDDLAFAAEDFKPLPEKEEEQSKPNTPKEIPFFDDEDLLL